MSEERLVPKLRFSGFDGEWNETTLSDIATFSKGKGISKKDISDDGIECVRYGELYTKYTEMIYNVDSKTNLDENELQLSEKYDILIPCSGETAIDLATASCIQKDQVAIGGDITIIKTNQYAPFITYYLNQKKTEIAKYAQGVSIVHLYPKDFNVLNIKIPLIKEQKKIVHILEKISYKEQLLEKKLKSYQDFKKYLMQQIFTQKLRFENYSEWEIVKLKSILSERKEYTSDMNIYPHVTLSKEGIFPKTERYNRDFLVKDKNKKYKVTHEGDICYNPPNLKFGVITLNKFGSAIFSPIYVTFEVHNANNSYLSYYLTRNDFINRVRRYEEGTVYERMAVKPSDFLNEEIKLPSLKEQEHISKCLENIDKKIESIGYDIDKIKLFKKGLLQQMFV